jgi:hypothetical protein
LDFLPKKKLRERSRITFHLRIHGPWFQLDPDVTKENRDANRAKVADCVANEFENLAGLALFDDRHPRVVLRSVRCASAPRRRACNRNLTVSASAAALIDASTAEVRPISIAAGRCNIRRPRELH